jgi:hypothetical protein
VLITVFSFLKRESLYAHMGDSEGETTERKKRRELNTGERLRKRILEDEIYPVVLIVQSRK